MLHDKHNSVRLTLQTLSGLRYLRELDMSFNCLESMDGI